MNATTPVHSPPKYCSRDCMLLVEKRSERHNGFDPFTGMERPRTEYVALECPTSHHDVWVLVGDQWVTP